MAGTADTRQLQLQISASTELLIRNLRQADNAVADFQRQTDRRLGAVDASFAAVGKLKGRLASLDTKIGIGGLASAATGVTLVELARRGLDYASSLGEVAQQLGVTTRDLQVYGYAASQAGIDQETMEKSLAKLTVTLGKAQLGAEKPVKAFNALGLSLADLSGKTAGEALPLIADGLAKISNPAKRAAIEVELFGKAGQKLDTLLAAGRGQIDELAAAAQRLGLVLSDEQIQKADEAADKISALKQVLEASIARSIADNADSILLLANSVEVLLAKLQRFNPAYSGFLRILQKDGVGAAARSFFGSGADQTQAVTEGGYAQLKIDQFKSARADYNRIKNDPGVNRGQVADRLRLMQQARVDADKAAADFLASRRRGATAPAAAGGGGDVDKIFAGGSRGGRGRSAEQVAREAAAETRRDQQAQRRSNDLVARADLDALSARADLSNDPEQRVAIERQRIDLARAARDADLDEQALDNRFIAANLERLKATNLQVAELDKQLLTQRRAQESEQVEFDRRRGAADDAIALDEIAARLTIVARDRYAIERRILAAKQAEEREALERVRANVSGKFTPEEVTTAAQALDRLPAKQAAERGAQARDQQGPIATYRDQLRAASDDTSEAIEQIAVRGFGQLEDAGSSAIASSVTNLLKLKGVAGSVVGSIIADLARLAIQKAIVSAIGGSFFGLARGGAIGDLPGYAGGGAPGGRISGPGSGTSDSILAVLGGARKPILVSNGEYIVNAQATREYGPLIEAINQRRLPRFATGGAIGGGRLPALVAPRLPKLGSSVQPQRVEVQTAVKLEPSPLFYASARQTAVQVVGAAAEPIMAGAEGRTMRRLSRPPLPGAPG